MTVDEAITVFSSYSDEDKREFLAHLMCELTIIARDNYEAGGDGLTNPQRMRQINEVQHRVSESLWALLRKDSRRYADDLFVKTVLEGSNDLILKRQLSEAFERLASHRVSLA